MNNELSDNEKTFLTSIGIEFANLFMKKPTISTKHMQAIELLRKVFWDEMTKALGTKQTA